MKIHIRHNHLAGKKAFLMSAEFKKPIGFILGAGFSKAISTQMPLTSDLTREVLDALEQKYPDIKNKLPVTNDIELLLTYLAEQQPWLDVKTFHENRSLFLQISQLIADCIIRHQISAILEIEKSDELKQQHLGLRALNFWLNNPSCVVSLNYDLLVEIIYTKFKQETGGDYRRLYSTVVTFIGTREGHGMLGSYEDSWHPFMVLYKLHGSINWRYSGSESFFGETIYELGLSPFLPRTELPGVQRQLRELEKNSNDKVPLIVPPTLHKENFFKNEFVRTHWSKSMEDISKCEEIYSLGYSLPKSDVMMQLYLSEVLKKDSIKKFYVVNNSKSVIRNYQEAFPEHWG